MESVISAIRNTISISLFNKGMAGKIFEEVKKTGPKVVMKNNNAECVLLSPEEYASLIDEINDAKLLALALQRLQNYDPSNVVPVEAIDKKFGITPEMLSSIGEVEFE